MSKWLVVIVAGVALVWGGGKAIDWYSSSHAESAATARVGALFTNLQANADTTIAVAMWLTGSVQSGSRQLDQSMWNAEYGRMMSWLAGKGLRYPISRFEIVSAGYEKQPSAQGTSRPLDGSSPVIVTCVVDGQTLFVRAVDGRELAWAPSGGE